MAGIWEVSMVYHVCICSFIYSSWYFLKTISLMLLMPAFKCETCIGDICTWETCTNNAFCVDGLINPAVNFEVDYT